MDPVSRAERKSSAQLPPPFESEEDLAHLPTTVEESFFQAHPAADIPEERRAELAKECQAVMLLYFTEETAEEEFSFSLLESVAGTFPVAFLETVANPENTSQLAFIFDNFIKGFPPKDQANLADVIKKLRFIFERSPHLLLFKLESILGLGLSPRLQENLAKVGLIPTQPGSTLTVSQGVSFSYLRWICQEFPTNSRLLKSLMTWMSEAKQGKNKPLPEQLLSELNEVQKAQQVLYVEIFTQVNKSKAGPLKLSCIPSPSLAIDAPTSEQNELAACVHLWIHQTESVERVFLQYAGNAEALINNHVEGCCDQAEIAHQRKRGRNKGVFDRQMYKRSLQQQLPNFTLFEEFRREVVQFQRTRQSRMASLLRVLRHVEQNPAAWPLLLAPLESAFRWMTLHHASFRKKTKTIEENSFNMFMRINIQLNQLKGTLEIKNERCLINLDPAFTKGFVEEWKSIEDLLLALSDLSEISEAIRGLIQRLNVPTDDSTDLLLELADGESTAPLAAEEPAMALFAEDDDNVEAVPQLSSSTPAPSAASPLPLQFAAETLSGKMLQALPHLLAPWNLPPLALQEATDHLFLATQSVELMCQLHAHRQFDLLSVCLQSYLVDMHVAMEQVLGKATTTHSLRRIAQATGRLWTEEENQLFKGFDQALLWARYPAHYLHQHQQQPPPPLAWLKTLTDKTAKEVDVETVFQQILANYRAMMSLIGQGQLPPFLLTDLGAVSIDSQLPLVAPKKNDFNDLSHQLQKALNSSKAALAAQEGDVLLCLEEVRHYLFWMGQAQVLHSLFPHPKWEYWFTRVSLNMDKLFKHLLAAASLLNGRGPQYSHNLTVYIDALCDLYPLLGEQAGLLRDVNINIGHHYIHGVSFFLSQKLRDLLRRSQQCELEAADGFSVAQRRGRDSLFQPLLDGSLHVFRQLLSLVLKNVPANPLPPQVLAPANKV
jgi:hypothetical protein